MYCPQCGAESAPNLQYCRVCGANLKVIGKAVAVSEAIARSDRGPLPKLKEMVKNLHLEHVTDEVSGALDKMNEEIVRSTTERRSHRPWWLGEKKSPQRRREDQRVKGTVEFFTGIGVTTFLYYLSGAIVLKLPPDVIAKIPFELAPLIKVIWVAGLIPTLSGVGHLAASFFIKSTPPSLSLPAPDSQPEVAPKPITATAGGVTSQAAPGSVTENTTHLLEREPVERNP
jgi:hypothetical protein